MFFGKKKEAFQEKREQTAERTETGIYVLGSGCKKCNTLEDHVKQALKALGIEENVFHITDFGVIAKLGVMTTPALVIDKKVVSYGKELSVKECEDILKKERLS